MPASVTAQYPGAIPSTIPTYDFTVDKVDTSNKEHDLVHNRLKNEIIALATELGPDVSAGFTDLVARLADNDLAMRRVVNVEKLGVVNNVATTAASANSALFNAVESLGGNTDWYFPAGNFASQGFQITHTGSRLIGAGGQSTTIHMDSTGNCITFAGTDAAAYAGRIYGVAGIGFKINNRSTGTNIGLKIRHVTGSVFVDVWQQAFRGDGGGCHAHDFADSAFYDCCWDFMASGDNTNKAVILFCSDLDAGETNFLWAVDQIRFFRCRWENCGDRLCNFKNDATHTLFVNKIQFVGCKFENSVSDGNGVGGSNDANQSQFLFDNTTWVAFVMCEWTYGNKRTTVTWTLQTIFRLKNGASVFLTNCVFHFGSITATQLFTNYFVCDAATQLLAMDNVWLIAGGSATSGTYPTDVISVTNSAVVTYKCVGFKGATMPPGGGVAGDWITGTPGTTGVVA